MCKVLRRTFIISIYLIGCLCVNLDYLLMFAKFVIFSSVPMLLVQIILQYQRVKLWYQIICQNPNRITWKIYLWEIYMARLVVQAIHPALRTTVHVLRQEHLFVLKEN